MLFKYFERIHQLLTVVEQKEKEKILLAAEKVAECIKQNGLVHIFGCGHSHLLAEEVFYRAGGLVPVKPILIEPLMLHEGAVRSSQLEKQEGYVQMFLSEEAFGTNDVVFVISTSGCNPVPIDVALLAKGKGAYVIGLTSLAYSTSLPARHSSGKRLAECVDLVLDNHSVEGDAILSHPAVPVSFAPTSTVIGASMLHAIFAEATIRLANEGNVPPVFLSNHLPGGKEHNEKWMGKYQGRIHF
ncbi:SIS domain-containing protein [Anoxybacillus suryakundensis]|uniref:UPF0309 protein Ga0061060_10997 n=1 Tax=Anoxybacillus suryakundensis TaxID=1325335 RepID=A0A0K6GPE0_9BACL|nr:SIS domain-containing protein [Anoxybacillus suryakundensis]CUA80418.1 Uncharacterized protein, contains SIS (Sugar ISomerase) phosphosugar binding domain [Anoxybacillus suryakundensis]